MSTFPEIWRSAPYREFSQLQRLMDRMWDDFTPAPSANRAPFAFSPKLEFTEEDTRYIAKIEVPGVSKDQVKIELHDNSLTISGERKSEKKEEAKGRTYSEVSYGSFSRTIGLPGPVDAERTSATFDHGVLTVSMEKSNKPGARRISIS